MKKVLLSAAVIFASYYASAQCPTSGLAATAAADDFSSVDAPSNTDGTGLYLWDDVALGTGDNADFAYSGVRTGSVLDVTITQPYGAYVPFGVSFGDGPATIDLSADASFEVTATNDGDSTIKFRMAIQDINDVNIDTYEEGLSNPFGDAWKYTIEIPLGPGETGTLSGTFAGGAYADYDVTGDYVTGFDYTQVKAILFTVANANQNASDGYKNYALEGYPVTVDYYVLGPCEDITGVFSKANEIKTAVYPNPASSEVNFGQTLTEVSVYNAQGLLVETLTSASSLNVSSYETGVYFINSAEGSTRFMVK